MSLRLRLDGRVAIVTGALGNLGPIWSSTLADAGATVVGIDVRDGDVGACARLEEGDVSDPARLDEIRVRAEADLGPVSVLVNNAGVDAPPAAGRGEETLDAFR